MFKGDKSSYGRPQGSVVPNINVTNSGSRLDSGGRTVCTWLAALQPQLNTTIEHRNFTNPHVSDGSVMLRNYNPAQCRSVTRLASNFRRNRCSM